MTTPGIYTQGMLIDQLSNVQRMITQADQKIGKDAYDRYADHQGTAIAAGPGRKDHRIVGE